LAIGTLVADRYVVNGVLGTGAMGEVYAAKHKTTGQEVALKFMLVKNDDDNEFAKRFEQEAKIMALLRHHNTIRIYDFGRTDDGALFMAMELLQGQGLDNYIRELGRKGTALTESEALAIGVQVCKSLQEAHGNGLVHRDLKPGNVFLSDDGSGERQVKVLDFGIARVHGSEMTMANTVMGTPTYMSPEQWQAKPIDGRSDLYAVGCILFACVAGRPPFLAEGNPFQLMHKHVSEPPPDVATLAKHPVSPAFVHILDIALQKLPGDRFVDAKSMRGALEAAAGGAWAGTPHGHLGAAVDLEATQALAMARPSATAAVTVSAKQSSNVGLVLAAVAATLALAADAVWYALRPLAPAPVGSTADAAVAAVPTPAAAPVAPPAAANPGNVLVPSAIAPVPAVAPLPANPAPAVAQPVAPNAAAPVGAKSPALAPLDKPHAVVRPHAALPKGGAAKPSGKVQSVD